MGRRTAARGWLAGALIVAVIGWAYPAQVGGALVTAHDGARLAGQHKHKPAPGITISLHAAGKGGASPRGQSGCSATITLQATVAYPSRSSWSHDTLIYQPPRGVRVLNGPAPVHHHKRGKTAAKPPTAGHSYGSYIQPRAKRKPPVKTHHAGNPSSVRYAVPQPRHGHSTVLLKLAVTAAPVQVRDRHGRRHKEIGAQLSGTLSAVKGGKTVAHLKVNMLIAVTCAAGKTHRVHATPTPQAGGQTPPGAATVAIHNFAFSPSTLTIAAGTTVVWTNQDSVAHTVTAVDKSWDSGNLKQGQSYSRTFSSAGTFKYFCAIHPFMKGTVIVTAPTPTTVPGAPTSTSPPPATATPVPPGVPAPPPPPAPTAAPQGALVQATIQNFAFNPNPIVIAPGTTVIWTNLDSVAHTVSATDGSWGSGALDQGASYSHTFSAAGTYTYICQIHPFMHGTVIVGSAGAPPPTATAMPAPTATATPIPTATATTPPGVNTPTPQPPATATNTPVNATVTISNFAFNPMTITVAPGTTVVWTNQDSVTHTVSATDGSWGSGALGPGATYSHTFTVAGTYAYICQIHPFMHGSVIVGAPPATSTPTARPMPTHTAAPATPTPAPATATHTAPMATHTPLPMATGTATAQPTATHTAQPTATRTATPTATTQPGMNTPTPRPTNTPTTRPTATPTPRPSNTPTAQPSNTPTAQPTATRTSTPAPTATRPPTATPTHTQVPPTATSTPGPGNVAVTIQNFAFHPMTVTITAGTTVVWTDEDSSAPHTVTADDNSWTSNLLNKGNTYSRAFTSVGTFKYHCSIHPFMHGTVIVTGTSRPVTPLHRGGTRHQSARKR